MVFSHGGGFIFGEYLTGKGVSPTNQCWCQKTRVISVLCGINISAVHHLVLSQYTRLTDGRTDGQNCDSNTVRCITCSRTVKTNLKKEATCFICVPIVVDGWSSSEHLRTAGQPVVSLVHVVLATRRPFSQQWRHEGVCLCCLPRQSDQSCNQGIFQNVGHGCEPDPEATQN